MALPLELENEPGAHGVHALAPADDRDPAAQSQQAYVPTPFLNFPAAHCTHGVPVKPIGHVACTDAPAAASSAATSACARAMPCAPDIQLARRALGRLLAADVQKSRRACQASADSPLRSSSISHCMHWHSTPAGYCPTPHASSAQRTHVRPGSRPHSALGTSGDSSTTPPAAMSVRPQSPVACSRSRSSTNGGWHASAQVSASTRTAELTSLPFSTRSTIEHSA
ncbi:MAG: hypothetical protein EBR09_15700 [Proteobacteria bacterium]|nr:hypothetical protein [Pseudomonadota bacterium]